MLFGLLLPIGGKNLVLITFKSGCFIQLLADLTYSYTSSQPYFAKPALRVLVVPNPGVCLQLRRLVPNTGCLIDSSALGDGVTHLIVQYQRSHSAAFCSSAMSTPTMVAPPLPPGTGYLTRASTSSSASAARAHKASQTSTVDAIRALSTQGFFQQSPSGHTTMVPLGSFSYWLEPFIWTAPLREPCQRTLRIYWS